jgi:hypothetical protein
LAAASPSASSLFSSLATSRKKRASSSPARCFSQQSITLLRVDCSLKMLWAFSPSFQKSGCAVSRFSSSIRCCFPSTSKPPPHQIESPFEVNQLFFGFF